SWKKRDAWDDTTPIKRVTQSIDTRLSHPPSPSPPPPPPPPAVRPRCPPGRQ
ncbi:terminase gpP N-terminus-related DNA-binding protein, partial [Klebsiella pneumoniae]